MASNSILKLQVDDKQYEASLKNAQQGLKALQDALRNSGKSFADVDKQTEEYVRALGKMDTTAKTARGGIGEMSSAFVELSRVEKQLTDQERQSPVGKALTESLAQLKQRTIDAKNELQGLENQLKNVGDIKLPDTSSGLFGGGKLDGMLQIFGGNMMTKAAGWATDFAVELGDAVKQGIELARQGEGIRIAFERLGRGDILDGLREATHGTVTDLELMKAAVKFNDFKLPVEELGTMLAFAQQKAKDTGQSVDYMVDSIVTGLGRKSLMILDNLGLSATEVKERMKETGDMTKAVGAIIREQMAKAGDYVETAADRATKADVELKNAMEDLGRTFQPLSDAGASLWNNLKIGALDLLNNAVRPLIDALTEAGRIRSKYAQQGGDRRVNGFLDTLKGISNDDRRRDTYNRQLAKFDSKIRSYQQYLEDYKAQQEGIRKGNPNLAAGDRVMAFQKQTGLSWFSDVKEQLAVFQKQRAEYVMGAKAILEGTPAPSPADSSGGKGGGTTKAEVQAVSGSIDEQTKKVQELQKAWRAAADDDSRQKIKAEIDEQQYLLDRMTGKENFDPANMRELTDLRGTTAWATSEQLTQGAGLTLPVTLDIQSPEEKLREEVARLQELLTNAFTDAEREALSKALKDKKGQLDNLTGGKDNSKPKEVNFTQEFSKMAGGIQSIVGGIENLGIEIPDGMKQMLNGMQGLISIVSGIATICAAIQTIQTAQMFKFWSGGGVVHAATGLIVPGNNYSGDMVPSMINSGELILNRAQQGVIASQLESGNGGGMRVVGEIQGEKIVLVANRFLKRSGQGELVTWK